MNCIAMTKVFLIVFNSEENLIVFNNDSDNMRSVLNMSCAVCSLSTAQDERL